MPNRSLSGADNSPTLVVAPTTAVNCGSAKKYFKAEKGDTITVNLLRR